MVAIINCWQLTFIFIPKSAVKILCRIQIWHILIPTLEWLIKLLLVKLGLNYLIIYKHNIPGPISPVA